MLIILLGSCASSSRVISENRIQKRKYQKGYYVHKTKKESKPVIFERVQRTSISTEFLLTSDLNSSRENLELKYPNGNIERLFSKNPKTIVNNILKKNGKTFDRKLSEQNSKINSTEPSFNEELKTNEKPEEEPKKKLNVLAILSLVALFLFFLFLSLDSIFVAGVLIIAAVVMSAVAIKEKPPLKGTLIAKVVFCFSAIILLIALIILMFMIALVLLWNGL